MKASEIRIKSKDEILEEIEASKREFLNIHFQWQAGENVDTTRKKKIKKDVARLKTVLKENELVFNAQLSAEE